jgi:membrane protein
MMKKQLRTTLRFTKRVVKQFFKDESMHKASELSFTTLLSLVPLMTISLAVFSAFPVFKKFSVHIQAFIFDNFVTSSAQQVQHHLQTFVGHASQLSAVGLLFLLIVAVFMIFNMERALNRIWLVKKQRHGVPAFLLYWAVLTLIPILIGVGFAVSSYIMSIPIIKGAAATGLHKVMLKALVYCLSWLAFTLLFVALPNCRVPMKCAALGGAVSMVLFECIKQGFGYYIAYFPTYELLYGALAIIPIFLVWIYICWLIILFGAEVSHELYTLKYGKRKAAKRA